MILLRWEKPFSICLKGKPHQVLMRSWTSCKTSKSFWKGFLHIPTILCSTSFPICKGKHATGGNTSTVHSDCWDSLILSLDTFSYFNHSAPEKDGFLYFCFFPLVWFLKWYTLTICQNRKGQNTLHSVRGCNFTILYVFLNNLVDLLSVSLFE